MELPLAKFGFFENDSQKVAHVSLELRLRRHRLAWEPFVVFESHEFEKEEKQSVKRGAVFHDGLQKVGVYASRGTRGVEGASVVAATKTCMK